MASRRIARAVPLLLWLGAAPARAGYWNCPVLGPVFPKPQLLSQNPTVQAAMQSLESIFTNSIDGDHNSTGSDAYSYSVEVFSGSEDAPLLSHHHTAKNLAELNSTGVAAVDSRTVYRLGSLTKVYTMLTFLAEAGDSRWNDPITKYVPELAELQAKSTKNAVFEVDWDEITIGALASQISGIARDYSLLGELTQEIGVNETLPFGFPALAPSEIPSCGIIPGCNRSEYFAGFAKLPPSFAPESTPAYSDIAYQFLAYALETITGKSFRAMVETDLIARLNLRDTTYAAPNDSLGVVPGDRWKSAWAYDLGEEAPTGNLYASAADVSTVGRAILRSTLLPPAMTRRWLKPASLSSDPRGAVGAPWGVRTIVPLPGQPNPYVSVTSFNKAGSIGSYSSLLCVIPDLDLGFTILAAGHPLPAALNFQIGDALAAAVIPAVYAAAREQADKRYAGTYEAVSVGSPGAAAASAPGSGGNSTAPPPGNATASASAPSNSTSAGASASGGVVSASSTPTALPNPPLLHRRQQSPPFNSSVSIATSADRPGLGVTRWVSNGQDMLLAAVGIQGNASVDGWSSIVPSARLYPAGLEAAVEGGGKLVGFKGVFENMVGGNVSQPMSTDCATWIGVTAVVYGSKPLDQFVFTLDKDGNVVGLEIPALRTKYRKVG